MPRSDGELIVQCVPTALGTLEIALPPDTVLEPDAGAVEGVAWWWSPEPGAGVLTINHGDAESRTPAGLLAAERALADVEVTVLRNSADAAPGQHELAFVSSPTSRDATGQRARFRFWLRDGLAVRVGYRVDSRAPAWEPTLDRVLDSARLG